MPIPIARIIEADLSYAVIGSAFEAYNKLGPGLSEKDYQQSFAIELRVRKIAFEREKLLPLGGNAYYAKRFADFLIAERIVVELKVVSRLGYAHVKQLLGYLQSAGLKLGILIYFTNEGVKYRRVLNSRV